MPTSQVGGATEGVFEEQGSGFETQGRSVIQDNLGSYGGQINLPDQWGGDAEGKALGNAVMGGA